jgi:hypothetical protein
MSEHDGERCILPPPLPDPASVSGRTATLYGLAARTAHLVARDAVAAFDAGDRDRFLAALDALVELSCDRKRRCS